MPDRKRSGIKESHTVGTETLDVAQGLFFAASGSDSSSGPSFESRESVISKRRSRCEIGAKSSVITTITSLARADSLSSGHHVTSGQMSDAGQLFGEDPVRSQTVTVLDPRNQTNTS